MIYLDNNATTRVAPEALDAMLPFLGEMFGNPSSAHQAGRRAKRAVERARQQVAALLGAADTSEIVFTSSGSEADNWAIRGALEANPAKRHIVTTRVEHEAVRVLCERLEVQGYEVSWLDVNEDGDLDLDQLRESLRADTAIVSVMLANNETGVLFPIEEVGRIVKENSSALFHVDGVQAVGKIPIDLKTSEVDLFALSGHKFHAPQGIGAMYMRSSVSLPPFIIGGGQESGRRAGTSAVASIVALGAAAELMQKPDREGRLDPTLEGAHARIRRLRDKLEDSILDTIPNASLNGAADRGKRLPNTANISFENIEGESITAHLDEIGVCVSTGSACHSIPKVSSPTLRAMNVPYTRAMGSIRFSLGRYNTEAEIDVVLDQLAPIIRRLVEMAPSGKA